MSEAVNRSNQSIFTHELVSILAQRGKDLESLRRAPLNIDKQKVERLQDSLSNLSRLPALSHTELMSVILLLHLTTEERLRLYAALIALGAQRLLLDYLAPERAWAIACEVRDAAYTWLQEHGSDDDLLRRRSVMRADGAENDAAFGEAALLDEALDAYDEGTANAALGLLRSESEVGQRFLRQAVAQLERARELIEALTPAPGDEETLAYWAAEIAAQLEQAQAELL